MASLIRLKLKTIPMLMYLPGASIGFTVLLIMILPEIKLHVIMIMLQLLYTIVAILWSLFLFYDFFSLNKFGYLKNIYLPHFGKLLLSFFVLLSFFLVLNLIIIFNLYDGIYFWPSFLLIASQMIISAVSVLILFALAGNVTFPLALTFLYLSAELATFGQSNYLYHLLALDFVYDYSFKGVLNLIVLNTIFGLSGYTVFRLLLR